MLDLITRVANCESESCGSTQMAIVVSEIGV